MTDTAGDLLHSLTITSLLEAARSGRIPDAPGLGGHGGLHGGLTLASLVAAAGVADGHRIRGVTGQFLRPVTAPADVEVDELRRGRTVHTVATRAFIDGSVRATATVTTGQVGDAVAPRPVASVPPTVPPPHRCDVLHLPNESATIIDHFEIRPATGGLPFSAAAEPELTAWVRLVGADDPPDVLGLIVLSDAIAASYTAVLDVLALTPTVELSVTPTGAAPVSPWVLVRTTSSAVSRDGWIDETIDLWDEHGAHLASARQLRLLVPL